MNSLPSNWTGRFARTSRVVYGYQVEFRSDPDRLVGYVVAVCVIIALGLIVGGAL
jgi:hypothetical protein